MGKCAGDDLSAQFPLKRSFALKRFFDIVVAAAMLILALPLMAATALAVRLALGSPVLLRQTRPGLHGLRFTFYKFRTMTEERDAEGLLLPDASRLTPLGLWLRSTSLDELPQLLNVVRGDMSLVGPRPLLMEYLPLYSPRQARRHEVRPGITGWAQVNGRNAISWEQKFDFDVWYVDHQCFALDLRILAMTVMRVFRGSDINEPGAVTMTKFAGTQDKAVNDG
jgi:sugar transferase EpsL